MATDHLDELQKFLISKNAISGYALISHNGCVECAFGNLEDELWPSQGSTTAPQLAVQHILAAFQGTPPTTIHLAGKSLVVVRQEDSYVYAVSKRSQLAISLHYLLTGVMVVSYSHSQQPQSVGLVKDLLQHSHTR